MNTHISKRSFVNNSILSSLPAEDLAAIGEYLEPVVLRERMVLQAPHRKTEYVYFVEAGLVSVRVSAAGCFLESALVGFRGAIGASSLLGGHIPTHESVVFLPGNALRIPVSNLERVIKDHRPAYERLSHWAQALIVHCAQTGLCGVRHDLEHRVATWLCLACDALGSRTIPVTHDYLSTVLGLRRPGVTRTLSLFEDKGLIRKTRGLVQISSCEDLSQKACGCLGVISGTYKALERTGSLGGEGEPKLLRHAAIDA